VGTGDGLAKSVYVRESRRIRAEFTVLEDHVGVEARRQSHPGEEGAESFPDSVGIGYYRIDLHPSSGLRNYVDISSYPFEIPLGALIPVRAENLLPACKNLGTTHITKGCYRLHPVEWNIGEAARPDGRVVVLGGVSPGEGSADPELLMLVLLGGKGRTLPEFRVLAQAAGLAVVVAGRQPSGRFVVECRPV
jgi:hypothetical protein